MKKHRNKIITAVAVVAVLVFAFWFGGNAPSLRGLDAAGHNDTIGEPTEALPLAQSQVVDGAKSQDENSVDKRDEPSTSKENVPEETNQTSNRGDSKSDDIQTKTSSEKDKYHTSPVPDGKPVPIEPENVVITDKEYTCTLSVRCDTILKNMAWLDEQKVHLVPKDGVIYAQKTVTFYEGESVFNLLLREMKLNKIHLEFVNTPIYNSAYIEGIANIYEFDCGELSGWMYKVNGWFPNYGCSRYQLKDGDVVEWVYTCDLGADIGGKYSSGNGMSSQK